MVPAPAVFIIGDDDERAVPGGAVLDQFHQIGGGLLAGCDVSVARVLVQLSLKLDERNRRQVVSSQVHGQLLQVHEVRPARRARGEVRVIVKRLVVFLEVRVGIARHRLVPAAGIPFPCHAGLAEAVSNRGILEQGKERPVEVEWPARRLHRVDGMVVPVFVGIDGQVVVELYAAAAQGRGPVIPVWECESCRVFGNLGHRKQVAAMCGFDAGRRDESGRSGPCNKIGGVCRLERIRPHGGLGGNEELVVEEGPAKGRVEEIIAHHILPGEHALGQSGGVESARDQAGIVRPRHITVHPATVDLQLLGVKSVDDVPGPRGFGHVLAHVKSSHGLGRRETLVKDDALIVRVERLGQ